MSIPEFLVLTNGYTILSHIFVIRGRLFKKLRGTCSPLQMMRQDRLQTFLNVLNWYETHLLVRLGLQLYVVEWGRDI